MTEQFESASVIISTKAVIRKENRVLMLKRSVRDNYMPGHWEFPGGKFESGDLKISGRHDLSVKSPLRASLKREVREEIGAEIIVAQLIPEVYEVVFGPEHPRYPGSVLVMLFFAAFLTKPYKLHHSPEHSGL